MGKQSVLRGTVYGLLGLVPVVFLPLTVEQFEFAKMRLLWVGAAVLATGVVWEWRRLRRDAVGLGLLVLLASTLLSSIFSLSPWVSLFGFPGCPNGVATTAAYVVIYFATQVLVREHSQAVLCVEIALWSGSVAASYGLAQYLGWDFSAWAGLLTPNGVLRPGGSLGHPNFLGGYLVMLVPLFVWRRAWLRAALICTLVVITQSRGAWVGLFAAGLTWWALKVRRVWPLTLAPSAILFSWLTGIAERAWITHNTHPVLWNLFERLSQLVEPGVARLEYWKTGLRIWARYPWLGSGTDTFQLAFQHQRTASYWAVEFAGAPHRAHNELINILATQGLAGLAALGLLVWAVAGLTRRALSQTTGSALEGLTRALICVLVAFAVQDLAGFTVAATGLLAVVSCALLTNTTLGQFGRFPKTPPRLRPWGLILVALFTTGSWVISQAITSAYTYAALQVEPHDPTQALALLHRARENEPKNPVVTFIQADALTRRGLATNDQEKIKAGIQTYAYAAQLDPEQAATHYMLGCVLGKNGRGELGEALRLEPENPIFLAGIAELEINWRDQPQVALELSRRGTELYPEFAIFHWVRAQAAELNGRTEEKLEELRRALTGKDFFMHYARPEMVFTPEQRELSRRVLEGK